MLKKLFKGGKWKLITSIFATIALVSAVAVLSLQLAINFSGKEKVELANPVYDDAYFDEMFRKDDDEDGVDNTIALNCLIFETYTTASTAPDKKTIGQWLVGIDFTKMASTLVDRAKYMETHSLLVPNFFDDADVVGVDLTQRSNIWNTFREEQALYSLLKGVYIPDTVRAITIGSFNSMSSLEYLRIPFVGTSRGSSARGMNYTLTEIKANGGAVTPTSDSLGSMFGKPFNYTRMTNVGWSPSNEYWTDFWLDWRWNADKTNGTIGATPNTNYGLTDEEIAKDPNKVLSKVYGARWMELSETQIDASTGNSQTIIESDKFYHLIPRSLQRLIITDDTAIGNNALTGCTARMIDISTFNGTALVFGNYALSECEHLTTVKLPTRRNVSFRKGTFNTCKQLESVILPPALTEIPEGFLYQAINLKAVVMPASIMNIDDAAFSTCSSLEKMVFYSGNSSDGISIDLTTNENTGETNIEITGPIEPPTYDFEMPRALRYIGTNAFRDCHHLQTIDIPDGVKTIGYGAFSGCYNIETMTLPFIGAHRGNCGSEEAEHNCNLDNLGDSTEYHGLFGWIFGITGGTERFYSAYQCYDGVEGLTFAIPKTLENVYIWDETVISRGALQNLQSIINLSIDERVAGNVATGSLNGCSNLVSLSISSVGNHIGDLFSGSEFANSVATKGNSRIPLSLVNVAVTNQTTMYTGAFDNCTRIKNVTIGNNTQVMQGALFYNNESLETLTIPFNGYERGEFYRIWWWWADKAVRNSVSWLFSPTNHPNTYATSSIGTNYYTRYIPTKFTRLTVTDETEIDTYSFRNLTSLESISITNVPGKIDEYSFYGCSGLQEVQIPYIGADLNRNGVSGYNHTFGWIFGSSSYEGSYDAVQQGRTYYIPEKLANVKVGAPGREEVLMSNKIFDHAFMNCKNIADIDFYNALINDLGKYAFANCKNLSQVHYPKASYSHVGDYAFYNCSKVLAIEDFTPSTVKTIGNYSFNGSSVGRKNLHSSNPEDGELVLDNFTVVGDYAFGNCLQIRKIDLPAGLTSIGDGVFSGCSYLEEVILTNNHTVTPYMFEDCTNFTGYGMDLRTVTSIPEGLFSGCVNLRFEDPSGKYLLIGDQTEYIGKYAFRNCRSIGHYVLPATLKTIDEGAFQGCVEMDYMTIPRNTTVIEPYGWIGCNNNFFFYVYEPEANWPRGWVNNWNCDYPVYILGEVADDIYTYHFDAIERKFYITGLKPDSTLNGIVTIPNMHNGITVIGIDETIDDTENPDRKSISTQTGITKVIIPKSITKIAGAPFATGSRVDVYLEFTKSEITSIYEESYANLEKQQEKWMKENGVLDNNSTAALNNWQNLLKNLKGWLPATESSDGVCYGELEDPWISFGIVYYKDYWQYGTGITYNVPYLNIANFKYTLSNNDNHYTSGAIIQNVVKIQMPGELYSNDSMGVNSDLLIIGAGGRLLSPEEMLKYTYYNNVDVGTATIEVTVDEEKLIVFNREWTGDLETYPGAYLHALYLTGKTNLHYKIQKSKLIVRSISGSIVEKVYDGKVYSYSNWATSEISGLEAFVGATFSGRIETRSENVGLYSTIARNLYWASDWRVYLNGRNITDNFDVSVEFSVYIIPQEVELVWIRTNSPVNGVYQPVNVVGTYTVSGKNVPLLEYPYIGGNMQVYAIAKNVQTGDYISPGLCPVTAAHKDPNRVGVYPYTSADTAPVYNVYAYISGTQAAKNYKLMEKQADGSYVAVTERPITDTQKLKAVEAAYRVCKGLITITIAETYKIAPKEDFWSRSWGFSGNMDSLTYYHVSLDGLGANSMFLGSLKTSSDALDIYNASFDSRLNNHTFNAQGSSLITWTNLIPGGHFSTNIGSGQNRIQLDWTPSEEHPYLIFNPTLRVSDESQYYDVVLTARVQILYNDFNPTYFVGLEDDQYLNNRYPNYIVYPQSITENTDGNMREYEYIRYMVDGKNYRLTVEDWNAFRNANPDYKVFYYKEDGTAYDEEGPIFKEIGEYVYAVQISGRHYNTLRKNIRVQTVKSNVEVAGLSKVYDRDPVDPLGTGKILKAGEYQLLEMKFTYYDVNGNLLPSAPSNVGKYSVNIYAPEGQYFNEYNRTHSFTISKRKIYVSFDGRKGFDGLGFSYTPLSIDMVRTEDNPDEGLLPGDEFIGTVHTTSFVPGTYSSSNTGSFAFEWSPAWAVIYDVDNSNVSDNYNLVFRGKYVIDPLIFEYTATGWTGDYDGDFHTGSVEVIYPSTGNHSPAPTPDYELKFSSISLSADATGWLDVPPVFCDPGEYELYYMIRADYFKTVIGRVKIKINYLKIEYEDPATQDSDGSDQYWTLQYDGRTHLYEIKVISPAFSAVVYYSLDGSNYSTQAPLFLDYGLHDVYYRIEAPYHETVGPIHRVVRLKYDIDKDDDEPDDPPHVFPQPPESEASFYADFFSGEYDGNPHSVDAGFSSWFLAENPDLYTSIYYSTDGKNWTAEAPSYTEIGKYLVTVKFMAPGYRTDYLQGYIQITSMQLFIETHPYETVFDGNYHMITLSSKKDQMRYDETTKTYFYKNAKMDEEVELKFYYTTNPNVVGGNSGWLPTVGISNGEPILLGLKDVDTYAVYVRVEADNFEPLVIQEFTRLTIKRLENPEISMESPQQFEYSRAPIDSEKIVINTIADGAKSYYYFSAYFDQYGEMKYDEPMNRIMPPTELGLYYVEVRVASSRNCGPATVYGFVQIVPKVLEVYYTNPHYYDGTVKAPNAYVKTGTSDVIHILTSIQGDKQPIEVGSYTFDVMMVENNPNYVLKSNTIEMEILKRSILFELKEEHLLIDNGKSPWTHLNSKYYDRSNQVADNKWYLLGNLSGKRTVFVDGTEKEVTYSGLAANHAIYANLETSETGTSTYFFSTIANEFYINSVIINEFDIYEIDEQGYFVVDEFGFPISVKDFYDIDYYLLITLKNPDIDLSQLQIINEYYYDGLQHSIQMIIPSFLINAIPEYEDLPGHYSTTPPPRVNVGDYEIKYRMSAEGFEQTYGRTVLKIKPAILEVEVGDLYKQSDAQKKPHDVYDDTPHVNDYKVTNILAAPMPVASHRKYYSADQYSYDDIDGLYKDFDTKNPIYLSGLNAITEAGTYYLVIYFAGDSMRWDESAIIREVKLNPRDLIIEMRSNTNFSKPYDGKKYSLPLTNATFDNNRTDTTGLCENHTIIQTTERMRLYTVQTISADAGDYDLLTQFEFGAIDIRRTDGTIVNSKNYRPVIHGNFTVTIEKAYLHEGDFMVEEYTEKDYDGYRHEPNYTCISDGELIITYFEIEDETGNMNPVQGNQKNAGHYKMYVEIGEGKNYHSLMASFYTHDANGNPYFPSPYLEAELVCYPKKVDVIWEDTEQTFTGEALTMHPWFVDNETDHDNPLRVDLNSVYFDNDLGDFAPSVINKGIYYSEAEFDTSSSVGRTYARNYTLENYMKYFNVLPMILQVQLGDGINEKGEDTNKIIYYNTQTAWRSELYKEDTPNAPEIIARTPEERAWLNNITISYPGNSALPATVEAVDNTVGTYRGNRILVNCTIKNRHGVDISKSITFEVIGSVTVMPHEIDFETCDVTLPYKENKGTSSVVGYTFDELQCLTIKNPKEGVTITNYVVNNVPYGLNFPNLSQAGEYDISFDIMASGYDAKKGSAHITITQFPAYMTFSKNLSKVYDGSSVDVSVLVQDSASGFNGDISDLIITYSELVTINGQIFEQVLESAPTNVGRYKVHIISSKDLEDGQKNYTTLDETQLFDITAKPIELTITKDVELLDDELLGKAWSSELFTLNAGDNPYIMSGDMLRYQFSTDIFTRGIYNASQMLKVDANKQVGTLDVTNTSLITADNGKKFTITWQLVKTNDKGQVVTQQIVDPNSDPDDPTYIEIPVDVSSNYYINLTFRFLVHYPYIPVTVKADPSTVDYDGLPHTGTIEFSDYTSANNAVFRPQSFFEDPANTTQLYSLDRDALTNNPESCKTSIEAMAFTEPGTYTVYYKIDTHDQVGENSIKFESATGSYTIIINKLNRKITESQSMNKEFNGIAAGDFHSTTGYPDGRYYPYFDLSYDNPEVEDYFIDATGNRQNVLGAWDWFNVIYKQAGQTNIIPADTGCINSGVYMYQIIIPESTYYKQATLQGNFVISKIRIYIENKEDPFYNVFEDYDGWRHSYNVSERDTATNGQVGFNVGIRKAAGEPLTPLTALENPLRFNATLITSSHLTGIYKGSDSTLMLFEHAYTVYDMYGNDVSINYLLDYSKATIEISPIRMEYFVEHPVYTYDNADHAFAYYITNPSNNRLVRVEWYNPSNGEWSLNPIYHRDVGEYEATIRMFADNYYPEYAVTLYMTINPAETYVEYVSNLSRVYDGREVTVPEIIKTSRDDAREGTDVRQYTYRYYKYDESGNLIPEPIFTQYYDQMIEGSENDKLVTNGHRPVDVGRYRMEIVIPASQNFEAVTYSDDFTISSYVTDVTWQNLSFVYDGTPKAPKAYLQLVPQDLASGTKINIVIDVDVVPNGANGDPNHINKGTYTATARLNFALSDKKAQNYLISTKSENVTFAIQPRSIRIELNYPQALYKGDVDYLAYYNGLNKKDYYRFSALNLVDNHTIRDYIKLNYDGPREYNKASDFAWMDGNLNTPIKSPRIYDLNNVDVTDNYIMGFSYYFVLNENITDAAVSITNYVGVYDGQWHTIDVDIMVDNPENFSIEYWVLGQSSSWSTRKPQRMDVGKDQISVRIKNKLTNETVFEKTAGITITPADPEIEFDDLNLRLGKIYDGSSIRNPEISYNGTKTSAVTYTYYRINDDGTSSKLNYNPIDVGTYRLEVEVPQNKNYNSVKHAFEPFQITPRTITIHIKNQTKLYDKKSWEYTVKDGEVENLVRGHTLRLDELSNNAILMTSSPEVGEYTTLGADPGFHWQNNYLRIYDADGNEVNGPTKENYIVNLLTNVQITERQFVVSFPDVVEIATGEQISISAKINGTRKSDGTLDPNIYADPSEVVREYAVLQNGKYEFYPAEYIQRAGIGMYNVRVRISAPNYETLTKEARLIILDPENPVYPPGYDPDEPIDPDIDPEDPDYPGPDDFKKNLDIQYDKDKIYDGVPYVDPIIKSEPGLKNDIKYYEWDYYIKNMDELDPNQAMSSNPVDAGRYVIVFKVSEESTKYAGQEYKQAIRISPRPVNVTWENLSQKYTGDLAHPLLPTAYYVDINGNQVYTEVSPQPGYINMGTYDVTTTSNDSNYVVQNLSAKFKITQNLIKDIVLLPPEEDYEAGDPIILQDTDGNKYIRKEDYENDPTLVDDPQHTFLIDEHGELWKYDETIPGWVPADLPYTMELDDSKTDEDGKHIIEVKVKLKNPGDDSWENNGTDDIIQTFPINPKNLPNDEYYIEVRYEAVWIYTGSEIEPPVTVYLCEVATNKKTELDPKHYTVEYNNNIDVTTEDNKAEIMIRCKENDIYYFVEPIHYFTIVASKPDVLELKDDALIQFITATYEDESVTIVEDGSIEHLAAGEEGLYLGHLHQNTSISEIIAQFKNDPAKLIVADQLGTVIEKEDYDIIFFGSGFFISLLDEEGGQVIDQIQGILYGDLNSDGLITDADIPEAQLFVAEGLIFSDVEAYYYFTGITNREIGIFADASIVDLESYVSFIADDPSADFNTFDGTYPATYGGASSPDAPEE